MCGTNWFLLLFERLTDEEAKKNWEEYGNPDGPQGSVMVPLIIFNFETYLLRSDGELQCGCCCMQPHHSKD